MMLLSSSVLVILVLVSSITNTTFEKAIKRGLSTGRGLGAVFKWLASILHCFVERIASKRVLYL